MFHNLPYVSAATVPPPGVSAPLVPGPPPAQLAPPPPPAATPSHHLDLSRVPPVQHDAAVEFDSFCSRLTFNSKDLINTLTRVAGENTFNAEGIVAVLEQRIFAVPPLVKLPFLYLVDSIVKNIGVPYVACFAPNLVNVFSSAYAATVPDVRMSMQRLLNTWPSIFGTEMVNEMKRRAATIDAPFHQAPPPHVGMQNVPHVRPDAPVSAPGLMQQPHVPYGAVAPPASSPQFLQVQNLMNEVTKDVSMGVPPSNHKLFNINRLITSLLQSFPNPVESDVLQRFQQQLRDLAVPQQNHLSAPPAPPTAPPPSRPMPLNTNAALTSLLSNPPPGLLVPPKPVPHVQPPMRGPPRGPPLRAVPAPPIPAVPRRPPPTAPVFATPLPAVLKFSDIKTLSHATTVRSLYTDLPFLSKSDGMRFATQDQLREHLDWIFKKNRSKRAHERGLAEGGLSRCWYEHLDVFLKRNKAQGSDADSAVGADGGSTNLASSHPSAPGQGSRPGGKDARKRAGAIPAQGASERCVACGEELEAYWDDEHESWMLQEATRTDEGVFHTKCMTLSDGLAEQPSGSTVVTPEKSEKDEPIAPPSFKLESKALAAGLSGGVVGEVVKAPYAIVGANGKREDEPGSLVGQGIKGEAVVGLSMKDGARDVPLAAEPGGKEILRAHPAEAAVVEKQPSGQGRKREREEENFVIGNNGAKEEAVVEESPEKRLKL